MRRHHAPSLARAVGVAGAVAALAACTADADGTPGPTATPAPVETSAAPPAPAVPPTPAVPPDPSSEPSSGSVPTLLTADGVEIEVLATDGAVTAEASSGQASATIDLAQLSPGQEAVVSLASDGVLVLRPDGSVTVRTGPDDGDDDSPVDAVAGLTPPDGAQFQQDDAGVLLVVAEDPPGTATFTLGTSGVEDTDWGEREGGRSLAVTPTPWARQARTAGVDVVWSELVADDPEVDTATMHDQLVCHSIGAPDKATWNLEPWRPDVGLLQVLAERCNPV